ncbi:MAG: ThiF family adenylyltransferase [Desulfohalobiaceae bacterium]
MQTEEYKQKLAEQGLDGQAYLQQAFSRNVGLISPEEQKVLTQKKVAIAGLGGVGGQHLITLLRLGFSNFHLADFDHFEAVNINRQYGANANNLGRPKLDVMLEEAAAINSFAKVTPFSEPLSEHNLDHFLQGVDIVLDGLDFFAVDVRRMLFQKARERGIYAITAGPIGFSVALIVFAPDRGMDFDRYFGIMDGMPEVEKYNRFFTGLTPKATHFSYMQAQSIKLEEQKGPSSIIGCQLCAALASTEVLRIALNRKGPKAAPHFFQFDAYTHKYKKGYLLLGYKSPFQKMKRNYVRKKILGLQDMALTEIPEKPDLQVQPGQDIPWQVMRYLLRAGIQAPSGDNAQPWKFAVQDNQIRLYLDREADHSFFNAQQLASIISCGSVLENLRVAASAFGLEMRQELLPLGADQDLMAKASFLPDGVLPDPLLSALWQRCTNRKPYKKERLESKHMDRLKQAVASVPGCELHIMNTDQELKKLADLVYQADRIRTEHQDLHEHLMQMIRFNEQQMYSRRDGLPLKNLEAGLSGELLLRSIKPWSVARTAHQLGLSKAVAKVASKGIKSSAAAGLITVSGMQAEDFLRGGQALERLWLEATFNKFSLQPAAALPLFWLRWLLQGKQEFGPKHQEMLSKLWPKYQTLFPLTDLEKQGQIMLFRLGRGDEITQRTLRRRPETFLLSGEEG